jgi:hypothetical protein
MEGDVRRMSDKRLRQLQEAIRVQQTTPMPPAAPDRPLRHAPHVEYGSAKLTLDGKDLSNYVRSVTVKQEPQRPIHCPSWLQDDEVIIVGTGQRWKVRGADWRVRAGEVQEMTLELISVGQADRERQRRDALDAAPGDVRECLKALYELEDALPPDKEAIVELTPDPPNRDRYTLRVVDRDSQ